MALDGDFRRTPRRWRNPVAAAILRSRGRPPSPDRRDACAPAHRPDASDHAELHDRQVARGVDPSRGDPTRGERRQPDAAFASAEVHEHAQTMSVCGTRHPRRSSTTNTLPVVPAASAHCRISHRRRGRPSHGGSHRARSRPRPAAGDEEAACDRFAPFAQARSRQLSRAAAIVRGWSTTVPRSAGYARNSATSRVPFPPPTSTTCPSSPQSRRRRSRRPPCDVHAHLRVVGHRPSHLRPILPERAAELPGTRAGRFASSASGGRRTGPLVRSRCRCRHGPRAR